MAPAHGREEAGHSSESEPDALPLSTWSTVCMHRREFAKRRRRLMDMMGEGSIAIVPTAPVRTRNRDVDFPYRPDSNFYYLTGFGEPEAVAVLAPGREQGEFVMFMPRARPRGGAVARDPARARRRMRASRRRPTRFPSATSTTSCRGCSRTGRACSTRWATSRSSISACSPGSRAFAGAHARAVGWASSSCWIISSTRCVCSRARRRSA